MKRQVRCTKCNFKGIVDVPKGSKVKFQRCPGCKEVSLR